MSVWDKTTPTGSDNISEGDDRIRELKEALDDALSAHGVFPGASPATAPIYIPRGQLGATGSQPAAASGGFYYDTTLNVMTWSDGTDWRNIGFEDGVQMVFYQATAPTGWAEINTPIADYFLNATTVAAADGGSETSTFNNVGADAHTHNLSGSGWAQIDLDWGTNKIDINSVTSSSWTSDGTSASASLSFLAGSSGHTDGIGLDGATDSDSHSHTHVQADHAYANVIICDKDAY